MCTNGKPKQRKYDMNMMDYNNPNDPWFNTGYDPYKGLNEKERIKVGCLQGAAFVVLIIMGLLLCSMLSGCTTTKYVQVPVVHNDTTIVTKHQRDSIWLHDSTYIKEKGDTVRIEKWHTKYIEKQVHDTTYIAKVDTIREVFTNEVEKPLTWWQQTKMHIGAIALYLLALLAVIWVAKRHLGKL